MSLAAPTWLLLLIPWTAAVVYLMLGKPPREAVPFLSLWRGPEARRQVKPSVSKLPIWIALMLLAAGVAIVAAARPSWNRTDEPSGREGGYTGISHVAVRGRQAMVRIVNHSSRSEASVTLRWAGGEQKTELPLPDATERNYFLDVPADLRSLQVALDTGQTIEMLRRRTWPRVEARMPLSPALRRMLDTYAAQRPAGDDSTSIAIAGEVTTLGGQASALLADASRPRSGTVTVIDHPVTRDINWPGLLIDPLVAAAPPQGFTPLVRVGDQPVLAVRESPRQVWVGFDTPTFARSTDYVIFWANVFDFTGQGGDVWERKPGTVFASSTPQNPVQNAVQNLAPWLALTAIALSAAGLALAPRVAA